MDYRGRKRQLTLSKVPRQQLVHRAARVDPVIQSRCEEILLEHLSTSPFASGEGAWIYKQKLVELFPYSSFWKGIPETIRIVRNGQQQFISLQAMESAEMLTTVMRITLDIET